MKVTQQLSREVVDGDIQAGHFVNTLTGEDLGTDVDIIIAYTFKGRFYAPREGEHKGQAFVATGEVAPSNWPEQFAGKAFVDIPEAEETYKKRVDEGEIEFGSGPPISTTYNYIALVAGDESIPVRISLMRTSRNAARKINTIIRYSGKSPWANLIHLDTERRESDNGPYQVVKASRGVASTPEQVGKALELANLAQGQQFTFAGDEKLDEAAGQADKPKPKTPEGGLAV